MASRGPPGDPGGPCLGFCSIFLGNFMLTCFRHTVSEAHHLFSDVTSSGGTVMSCVMSQHCTYTSHITFCYKRSANTSFKVFWLFWLLVHPSGLPLSPTYGWCLTCVGRDMSSASLGCSLLSSSIFIVLALVNSAMSHRGT